MKIFQVQGQVDRAVYKHLVGRLEAYLTTNEVMGRTRRDWLFIEDCFAKGMSITACYAGLYRREQS